MPQSYNELPQVIISKSMANVRIYYSSPTPHGRESKAVCYNTAEKRRRKREKQRTADTLKDWDCLLSSVHHLMPTLKPIVFPINRALLEQEQTRHFRIKVSFTYGDQQCQLLEVEIGQLKQVLMRLESEHEDLMAVRKENKAYYDQQALQLLKKCGQLQSRAQSRSLQLEAVHSLLSYFNQ